MIGNDIIDLQLAGVQSDWQRPRFRERVFTANENQLIDSTEDPFYTAWRLWSMKESGYKALVRLLPKRFFSPKKLECSIAVNGSSSIRIGEFTFLAKTVREGERLHTTAQFDGEQPTRGECFTIPSAEDDSRYCHRRLRHYCAELWSLSIEQVHLEKTDLGAPQVSCLSHSKELAASISHHGRFGAFICW